MNKTVFIDRDGVIIDSVRGYVNDISEVTIIPGAVEGLRRLGALGYTLAVVTNQGGVGKGIMTLEKAESINKQICDILKNRGAYVHAWYMCPHAPDAGCKCRKPGTLMGETAVKDLNVDLSSSYMIGDHWTDMQFGLALGVKVCIKVLTGRGAGTVMDEDSLSYILASDLNYASKLIEQGL